MNSRFTVALHILTFLAEQQGEPATSKSIASSVNTNPSLVRRLLSQLAKAGLTRSQLGVGGGAVLARPPNSISLLDAYVAVEDDEIFGMHRSAPNPKCVVGRNIQSVLKERFTGVSKTMRRELGQTSIADLAADVRRSERRRRR